jgi:hypothetical protein
VLGSRFGRKRGEEQGNGEDYITRSFTFCYSPDIIRVIKSRRLRWTRRVARIGEGRGAYRVFVGKPERRRPLGGPRHRWEDSIKMDLREVGSGGMVWIDLAEDRDRWRALVNAVMNLRVP